MRSKSPLGAQISLTILTVIFVIAHYGYTADIVASSLGYLFSALAFPIIIYALAFTTVFKLNSNKLATKQKVELFIFPLFINLILFGTLYFMVQYGAAF
ncbi:hypothetical protein tloyanaT_32190 [Thalassotalea loyana]|uniref:Amino acid permease n=2 Tax=Thalassotalea loyana TaxID=280483 RepID=A0ABQ6HFT7_9GAMM|nr:hypothetical protein tloyanaT_32190 [Thalassotalea loyana]